MKKVNVWKNLAAVVTLVSISVFGSITFGAKSSMAAYRYNEPCETEQTSYNNYDPYQEVAAFPSVCRQVVTNGGRLHVRQSPNGRIIGYLYNGNRVRVVGRTQRNGWVRLANGGYIYGSYLRPCPRYTYYRG